MMSSPDSRSVAVPVPKPSASISQGPSFQQKLVALLALTAVSTSIGVTTKISQSGGRYAYSAASAVVMTEAFKLVTSFLIVVKIVVGQSRERNHKLVDEATAFFHENFSLALLFHTAGLAAAYCIVNLVTYSIFVYTPASFFFLLKASSPVITAIMLRMLIGRAISGVQWVAISMQCVGLVTTQYNPCTKGFSLAAIGYILVAVNIIVSCGAGVWNENVIKTYKTSVNAQNVMLYIWGVLLNMVMYYAIPNKYLGGSQQGVVSFFDGYNWTVVGVICANGMVGLVITAVYKYADVVVKTFGLAGSTSLLYVMEAGGILPTNVKTSVIVTMGGSAVVFYASYLYIAPSSAVVPSREVAKDEPVPPSPVCGWCTTGVCFISIIAVVTVGAAFVIPVQC